MIQNKPQKIKELSWKDYWRLTRLPLLLWLCRAFCFVLAYRYHDWQSLAPLVWLLHSACFQDRAKFVRITLYAYLPLINSNYLWYFLINVYGVVEYQNIDLPRFYQFGFYQFVYAPLDFAYLCLTVIALSYYCRLNLQEKSKPRNLLRKIQKHSPNNYAFVHIALKNIQPFIFTYAVIFSLLTLDLYHVSILFVMVIAQLRKEKFKQNLKWLILYICFFIVGKYVATLVNQGEQKSNPIAVVIGLNSIKYDPLSTKSQFRYNPPAASWVLLFSFAAMSRCDQYLGAGELQNENQDKQASESIQKQRPRLFQFTQYAMILWNHNVVLITFLAYLLIIFSLRRTFMNLITLMLVLTLMGCYISFGLKPVLRFWRFLAIYQAVVLLTLLTAQFMLYTKQESTLYYPQLTKYWDQLSDYQKAVYHYSGFYQFTDASWKELFPYVFMYFWTIIGYGQFVQKQVYEDNQLITSQADSEIKIQQNYFDMKYKLHYILYKFKAFWSIFDTISLNFNIVLITFIIGCGLYYTIALIWFIFILIFVVQTWWMQRQHKNYAKAQRARFIEQADPFQSIGGRFDCKSAQVSRLQKLYANTTKQQQQDPELRKHLDNARKEIDRFDESRMKVTDEECRQELQRYQIEIYSVTISSRYHFWLTQFSLLVVSMLCIYISDFFVVPSSLNNPQTLIPQTIDQNKVLFIFFWAGFYQNVANTNSLAGISYFSQYWPFFVLLILLIVEKLCQIWLQDKFGLTDGIMDQFRTIEERYKRKERIEVPPKTSVKSQLIALLKIKSQLQLMQGAKFMIQELAIMLVFFSLIYKQSILSFVLLVTVIYYTICRFSHKNPTMLVRYVTVAVILTQYLLALTNLSSYNSPSIFPYQLRTTSTTGEETVYPNPNNYYFATPWYFKATSQQFDGAPKVNVGVLNFLSIAVGGRVLNGMWIDFIVVVIMYVYLNNLNLWLINKPYKVELSQKTLNLAKLYKEELGVQISEVQLIKQMRAEIETYRLFKGFLVSVFTNWSLLMIIAIILAAVLGLTVIQFIYFIFAMLLIFIQRDFYRYPESRELQITILRRFLLPYIFFDIAMQLLWQIPLPNVKSQKWTQYVGFEQAWLYNPTTVYLGEDTTITETPAANFTMLIYRGVLYFMVSLQLSIITSKQFLNFYDKVLFENQQDATKIGLGLAYRRNNLKNRQLAQQASYYQHLDRTLKQVKLIIKEKQLLNRMTKAITKGLLSRLELTKQQIDAIENQKITQQQDADLQKLIDYRNQFEIDFKREYELRLERLSIGHKVYLWIRANYVIDILFRHSQEHLDDIVEQFRQGRTCTKSALEIGLEIETKQALVKQMPPEIQQYFTTEHNHKVKPWEEYESKNYKSSQTLVKNYFNVCFKVVVAYWSVVCFGFMVLCVVMNGGLLYMVYPLALFGVALCEEEQQGRVFWYFIIFYTQAVLILQYLAQFSLFQSQNNLQNDSMMTWSATNNFGIKQNTELIKHSISTLKKQGTGYDAPDLDSENLTGTFTGTFRGQFWMFFPEIALLISILLTIQQQTIAGIFDISLYKYETFAQGLARARAQHDQQDYLLDNKPKLWSKSENDAKEQIQMLEPNDEPPTYEELASVGIMLDLSKQRARSHSWDRQKYENFASKLTAISRFKLQLQKTTQKLFDNSFFDRLFPRIKQQKPGRDLYSFTACTSILIILYIILFTNQMTKKTSSISLEFSSNLLSGDMVVAMIVMVIVMVVDRYFYVRQQVINTKNVSQMLGTDQPLLIEDETLRLEQNIFSAENIKFIMESGDTQWQEMGQVQSQENAVYEWLRPQYCKRDPLRVARWYWLWFILLLVHWYIFFSMTNKPQVCQGQHYCNRFDTNASLIIFYLIFCVYFALQASQIKFGLPELKEGFLITKFDAVSKLLFQTWYQIPFLFELRTVIDWTFTRTSLDVFQAISLAQIQANMYVAKSFNRPYMARPLGTKIQLWEKIASGCTFTLFIITLIVGPMLLFSTFNPISRSNLVSNARLEFDIQIDSPAYNSSVMIQLYSSTQLTYNNTLTQEQYEAMDFANTDSQSSQFQSSQTQAIQFQPVSDQVWRVTTPKKQQLLNTLSNITNNASFEGNATAIFRATFQRSTAVSVDAVYQYTLPLLNSTEYYILIQLQKALACQSALPVLTQFPNNINVAIRLNQLQTVQQLEESQPVLAGFDLIYQCDPDQKSSSYWSINQTWPFNPLRRQELEILNKNLGFGFFTFNQNVLPNFLKAFSSSVLAFYITIVYVIAVVFRASIVDKTWAIYIRNAPQTEKILAICQCIQIYRVQQNLANEEELYHILLDVMRTPEQITELTGSSLKNQ